MAVDTETIGTWIDTEVELLDGEVVVIRGIWRDIKKRESPVALILDGSWEDVVSFIEKVVSSNIICVDKYILLVIGSKHL
jgi:hypothetical protein